MWCTRWFLPLVILPLPSAPPYFLLILLISQFVHARPCFYCMMLLTALYTSSCYWQAIRIDAPLTQHLVDSNADVNANTSIITFADAIRAGLSSDALAALSAGTIFLSPFIQLLDRCWCNLLPFRGLFDSMDVPTWEQASVRRLQSEIEAQNKVLKDAQLSGSSASSARAGGDANDLNEEMNVSENYDKSATEAAVQNIQNMTELSPDDLMSHTDCSSNSNGCEQLSSEENEHAKSMSTLRQWKDLILPFFSKTSEVSPTTVVEDTQAEVLKNVETSAMPEPSIDTAHDDISASATGFGNASSVEEVASVTNTTATQEPDKNERLTLFRSYYDLRPYGLDITIDFGWKR